ncbi:alpha/beta fold hydrolase [Streptomyces sp. BE20]|uniref:alpha/beta fold hydrolase n=1 Tax=Streptomyces sp. BE20 TaxID=3002525 RepID=UPI002E762D39|nr:alpha/beta fold hydrolase [Streptomyces sp. BE20]MEE1824034.1 alpha/beta fold hydrolase [Streptomyces sp. BE20]
MREIDGLAVRIITPAEGDVRTTGGEPPVVLLHGFVSDGVTDWIAPGTAAALAATGRTVVVPDLPGHGASADPVDAAEMGAGALTGRLLAALDALGVGEFDLVGYSLGARLAWEFPAVAPGRVGRVVLGGLSPREPFAAVDVEALHRAVAGGGEPEDPFTGMVAGLVRSRGDRAPALARCVEGLRNTPFAPGGWAGRVAPVVVVGADDVMTRGIESIVAPLDGAELVTVPGDHLGAVAGAEFRRVVLKALAR